MSCLNCFTTYLKILMHLMQLRLRKLSLTFKHGAWSKNFEQGFLSHEKVMDMNSNVIQMIEEFFTMYIFKKGINFLLLRYAGILSFSLLLIACRMVIS